MDQAPTRATHDRLPPRRVVIPPTLPKPINPALVEHAEKRARDVQNRAADQITRFSGSMTFVYLHVIWFACWIGFGVEAYPYGLLTMIVSLEAIFLSTFVMISQNRADAKHQVIADQQWRTVQEEDQQNRQCSSCPSRSSTSPRLSTPTPPGPRARRAPSPPRRPPPTGRKAPDPHPSPAPPARNGEERP